MGERGGGARRGSAEGERGEEARRGSAERIKIFWVGCTRTCNFGGRGAEECGSEVRQMKKKLTGAELDRFCREFLLSMDPNRAAGSVGREDGYALLRMREVEERLKWMRQMELPTRQDVLRRLGQMAFGRVSDAARLANRELLESGELDLSDVAELKITDKGTEMKLIDRVQALETLWGLLEAGGEDGMERFLQALKTEDERKGDGA